jgi:hypothetical protein
VPLFLLFGQIAALSGLAFPANPLSKSSSPWTYMFMTSLHMIPQIGLAMKSTMAEISRPKCLLPPLSKQQSPCFWQRRSRWSSEPQDAFFGYTIIYIVAHASTKFHGDMTKDERYMFLSCARCPCCPVAVLMPVGMRVPDVSPLRWSSPLTTMCIIYLNTSLQVFLFIWTTTLKI